MEDDNLKKTAQSEPPPGPPARYPSQQPIFDVTNSSAAPLRDWDGGICNCCGSPCSCCPGWGICCLVFCSFGSCLFGLNQKRAFGISSARAIGWTVLFFSLTSLFGLIATGVNYFHQLNCLSALLSNAGSTTTTTTTEVDFEKGLNSCLTIFSASWVALTVVSAVLAFAAIGLGAWRRTRIRERHMIRGSAIKDFCAWLWCSPCALCQETRTLELRGVREGVWLGSDPLAAAPAPAAAAAAAAPRGQAAAVVPPKVQEMPSKVV